MKVLLVGVGPRGIEHGAAIQSLAGWSVAGAVDPSPTARDAAARALGVATFDDLGAALERSQPDIVTIAVPPGLRAGLLEQIAACRGVRAVLFEKPLATGLAEARRMIALAEDAGIQPVVCHQLRFSPEFMALRKAVADGRIGEIKLMRGRCYGNILDQGPHLIDAMHWLAGGRRFEWVMSQACDDAKALAPFAAVDPGRHCDENHPAPFFMTHTFGLQGGIEAFLHTGIIAPASDPDLGPWLRKEIMVVGGRGWASARVAGAFRLVSADGVEDQVFSLNDYMRATAQVYVSLAQSLQSGNRPPHDARDALHAVEAMIAAGLSAQQDTLVKLPLPDDATFPDLLHRSRARAGQSNVPKQTDGDRPVISVLIPLSDHRGFAEACIRSWVNARDVAPASYEIVAVGGGGEPEVERVVRNLLRPRDRFVHCATPGEMAQYNCAAQEARGDTLFLTEPHCIAEPETLAQAFHYLANSDEDGAVVRSVTAAANAIARMEARMYDEGFRQWSRPESWCKVILRGFVIRRAAFFAAGGFDPRYGRFAEWLLAARLHRQGYRLGYMPAVALSHWYEPSLKHLRPFIRDFTEGECAYRLASSPAEAVPYFGDPPEWLLMRPRAPELGRLFGAVAAALAKSAYNPRDLLLLAAIATRLPSRVLEANGNLSWHQLKARLRVALAAARCLLWRGSERRLYRAYVDHYMGYTTMCRIDFIARQPRAAVQAETGHQRLAYQLADVPADDLSGFYPTEGFGGASFRWASGLAALRVRLPANASRVTIDTGGLTRRRHVPVAVFLDAVRIESLTEKRMDDGRLAGLEGRIPPGAFQGAGPHWMIVAVGMPNLHRPADPRDLGLPIVRVTFATE